ncbi:hypothetical protein B0H13DRAFT_1880058 [Mycena leptocephala]|nr:hypothetical protein B0H13DRAFT_1880058 [Mycena leptocephala]
MSSRLCGSSSVHLHPDQERPAERTPVRWSTHPMASSPVRSHRTHIRHGHRDAQWANPGAAQPNPAPRVRKDEGKKNKGNTPCTQTLARASTLPVPSFATPLRLYSQASSARRLSRAALSIAPPGRRRGQGGMRPRRLDGFGDDGRTRTSTFEEASAECALRSMRVKQVGARGKGIETMIGNVEEAGKEGKGEIKGHIPFALTIFTREEGEWVVQRAEVGKKEAAGAHARRRPSYDRHRRGSRWNHTAHRQSRVDIPCGRPTSARLMTSRRMPSPLCWPSQGSKRRGPPARAMDTKDGAVRTHHCGRPVTDPSPNGASRPPRTRAAGWGVGASGEETPGESGGGTIERSEGEEGEMGNRQRMQGGSRGLKEVTNQERVSHMTTVAVVQRRPFASLSVDIRVSQTWEKRETPQKRLWRGFCKGRFSPRLWCQQFRETTLERLQKRP